MLIHVHNYSQVHKPLWFAYQHHQSTGRSSLQTKRSTTSDKSTIISSHSNAKLPQTLQVYHLPSLALPSNPSCVIQSHLKVNVAFPSHGPFKMLPRPWNTVHPTPFCLIRLQMDGMVPDSPPILLTVDGF